MRQVFSSSGANIPPLPPRDSFHCPKITGSQLLHLTNGLLQPNHGRKLCGPLIHSLIKRVSRNFTVSNRPDLSRYRRFMGHKSDFIPDEAIRDTKFKSPHKNCFPLISKLLSESLKVGDISHFGSVTNVVREKVALHVSWIRTNEIHSCKSDLEIISPPFSFVISKST